MKLISVLFAALLLINSGTEAAGSAPGKVTGGSVYAMPQWFKSSFLDFQEETEVARERGKHVMVFMHLDECPYCERMLKENFISGEMQEFMEKNFDVIAVNVRGDLEVSWIDGNTYTERELKEHLQTIATPTIVFLDLDGNKVLQLHGYRDQRSFRYALEYVQSKRYRNQLFADYLAEQNKPTVYAFRSHPQIAVTTYFKGYDKPLMVLFEDKHCAQCDRFHEKTLNHPDVLDALESFLFIRLDAASNSLLIDVDGQTSTPANWMKELGLTYRPSLVIFNQGKEMFRADGQIYHHHLTEGLRYVSEGYMQYATLREFKDAYRAGRLKEGFDVNFAE